MNRKPRPQNGPGNNGLRGGTKTYCNKTFNGNFIDDVGGPSSFKRGFHVEDYMTEQQNQQMGRTLKFDPLYGAALPREHDLIPKSSTDIFNPKSGMQSSEWRTNMQLTHTYTPLQDERLPHFSVLKGEELAKYRQTWTSDNAIGRQMRFQTEALRSTNASVPKQFQVNRVRFLPGTPLPLEKLREKLLERHGILAFSALRFSLGPSTVTGQRLWSIFKELGLEVSKADFCHILAFLTPTDEFESTNLMRIIVGSGGNYDHSFLSRKFADVFPERIENIVSLLNYDIHADLANGIRIYIGAYASDDGLITESSFLQFHQDMFASNQESFGIIIGNIWH